MDLGTSLTNYTNSLSSRKRGLGDWAKCETWGRLCKMGDGHRKINNLTW